MDIPRPLRLVYIEWEDASSIAGWYSLSSIEVKAGPLVRQVGFIVQETSRYLLLSSGWITENDWTDEVLGDLSRIPKGWIRKRVVLGAVQADGTLRVRLPR